MILGIISENNDFVTLAMNFRKTFFFNFWNFFAILRTNYLHEFSGIFFKILSSLFGPIFSKF